MARRPKNQKGMTAKDIGKAVSKKRKPVIADKFLELSKRTQSVITDMGTNYHDDMRLAELYVKGGSTLPKTEGRSSLVKTEVADTIRALMPSCMRVLLQGRRPVEYLPSNANSSAFAEQQSLYVSQSFMANGGYRVLYDSIQSSFKAKVGPIKSYWKENADPTLITATGLTMQELAAFTKLPDIELQSYEAETSDDDDLVNTSDKQKPILYTMKALKHYQNGKIETFSFPAEEFFVEEGAVSLDTALHGHTHILTVNEVLAMGIDYSDWDAVVSDPSPVGSSVKEARTGIHSDNSDASNSDPMMRKVLVTEAYTLGDFDGNGRTSKYVVYFLGENYTYVYHEEIEDFAIDLVVADPINNSIMGDSYYDVGKQGQDAQTALLRMIMDNAAQANNPRPIADPLTVNFDDLQNPVIGSAIKRSGNGVVDFVDVPFTATNLLPFLATLERSSEIRSGVTKASTGLDPNALQSTDKEAVANTIAMGQGQVELYVRNIIETGVIPLFRRLLRLSMRHVDKNQVIRYRGDYVPVDISNFDPMWAAEPNVGLGTASPEQKMATLQVVMSKQEEYIMKFGLDNPFTSLSQMHNTLSDMIELGGLNNVGRYFNHIDPAIEAQIGRNMAKARQEAEQNQQPPADPTQTFMMVEMMKSKSRNLTTVAEQRAEEGRLQLAAMKAQNDDDFRRDKLAQDRILKLAELDQHNLNQPIKEEQNESRTPSFTPSAGSPDATSH